MFFPTMTQYLSEKESEHFHLKCFIYLTKNAIYDSKHALWYIHVLPAVAEKAPAPPAKYQIPADTSQSLLFVFCMHPLQGIQKEETEEEITEIKLGVASFDSINPILSKNKNVQDISKIIFLLK